MGYIPQPVPQMVPQLAPSVPRSSGGSVLVVDTTGSAASAAGSQGAAPAGDGAGLSPLGQQSVGRMRASALANRSNTVAQGVLIPAVLETAFDSTRPGFARAIVSRDVRGFDGTKVLIPRGSRLIGVYRSETAQGQNRALVTWTRLIRPDGVTIGMDSPSVDTLGRGGIPASVNTHFFERFAGALLQSTIDIGRTVAGRAATGTVIVAVPGSVPNVGSAGISSDSIAPTLKVRAGKSISVFVAHDLDFGTSETGR
jgi:type IV secretion system protein VirB10